MTDISSTSSDHVELLNLFDGLFKFESKLGWLDGGNTLFCCLLLKPYFGQNTRYSYFINTFETMVSKLSSQTKKNLRIPAVIILKAILFS